MDAIYRRRIDPLKPWGRIRSFGEIKAERFEHKAPARAALQKQAARKQRRGYAI